MLTTTDHCFIFVQTYFHVDLVAEELNRRNHHQLAPADPFGPTTASSLSPPPSPRRYASPPSSKPSM